MSMISTLPMRRAKPASSSHMRRQCCAVSTPLPRCACTPTMRISSVRATSTNSSTRVADRPNLDALPPVLTFSWWPSPWPRSMRSHRLRPRNSSGQRCSSSTLSTVTVTPSANAASYSAFGAKLGVNSTRRGDSSGKVSNTRRSSPCDTHSRPKPSATSVSRIAGCELALIA